MTTPSVVKNARTLLAQRASSATNQVSLRSIMGIHWNYIKFDRKAARTQAWLSALASHF
jgi:hypothetical protein